MTFSLRVSLSLSLALVALLVAHVRAEDLICNADGTFVSYLSSGISGDPHFSGFRGQRFEFQGRHGETYNLFSAASEMVNARFFGNSQWGDSRTFVEAVGVSVGPTTQVSVECLNGTLRAEFDGNLMVENTLQVDNAVNVFSDGHKVSISTPLLAIQIEKAKNHWASCFLNLNLGLFASEPEVISSIHGLIGQTARFSESAEVSATPEEIGKYEDGVFHIEGEGEDYRIIEGSLFGHQHRFDRFTGETSQPFESRRLMGKRAILQNPDCSSCFGTCTNHPDGMNNCAIISGLPECYDTDPNVHCAPSGCPLSGGPCTPSGPCDVSCRTASSDSCGFFVSELECNSHYSNMGGMDEVCFWDTGICSPDPSCMPSGGTSSSSSTTSSPCTPSDSCDVSCRSLSVAGCSTFIDDVGCNGYYQDVGGENLPCFWDFGSNTCQPDAMCSTASPPPSGPTDPCVEASFSVTPSCGVLTTESDCTGTRQATGSLLCEWNGVSCTTSTTSCLTMQLPCSDFTSVSSCGANAGDRTACTGGYEGANSKCVYSPYNGVCAAATTCIV